MKSNAIIVLLSVLMLSLIVISIGSVLVVTTLSNIKNTFDTVIARNANQRRTRHQQARHWRQPAFTSGL